MQDRLRLRAPVLARQLEAEQTGRLRTFVGQVIGLDQRLDHLLVATGCAEKACPGQVRDPEARLDLQYAIQPRFAFAGLAAVQQKAGFERVEDQ